MIEDSFAFRLKELLEHKQLTLQAVATAVHVSRPAVHKWTKGGEIDHEKLRKLAAFLDVNWIWLRYGEQEQPPQPAPLPQQTKRGAQPTQAQPTAADLPMTDTRRRYLANIMESEARMKLAQEGARIVTWEWNLITDGVTYSSNVEAVYGWRIVSNESFWKHVHPDDVSMMRGTYEESLRTGLAHEFDFRLYQPDGTVRWISSRATPVRDLDGRIVKIVGISMDNTARKMAEQSLRDQQARYETVLGLASEGLALLDANLYCESANAALANMLGVQQEALLGDGLAQRFADGGARLKRMAQGKRSAAFTAKLRGRDDQGLKVKIRAVLTPRDDDAPAHYALAVSKEFSAGTGGD